MRDRLLVFWRPALIVGLLAWLALAGIQGAEAAKPVQLPGLFPKGTQTFKAGHSAAVLLNVGGSGACVVALRRGNQTSTVQGATAGELIRLTWRVPRSARSGRYTLRATCQRTGEAVQVTARRSLKVTGGHGRRLAWSRKIVFADTVPAVNPGASARGGNSVFQSPAAFHQCVWYADQRRPDIYEAAVNHGVPKEGFADQASDDAWWDAWRWADNAAKGGLPEGHTPVVGSIVVFPRNLSSQFGHYGHVAYVEAVNSDGTYNVSEYNRDVKLGPGTRANLPKPTDGDGLVFIYGGPAGNPSFATVNGPPKCDQLQGGCTTPPQNPGSPQPGTTNPQGNIANPQQTGAPGAGGGGGAQPEFPVMNTSETPPDGVYFRSSPHTADTNRVTGYGVFAGDTVRLRCYATGDAVGPNDTLWYYVDNVTRPTVPSSGLANTGYINAHYIDDKKVANQVDDGVLRC